MIAVSRAPSEDGNQERNAELLPHSSSRFLVFLLGDDRIAHNFFKSAIAGWCNIRDPKKTSLMSHSKGTREFTPS